VAIQAEQMWCGYSSRTDVVWLFKQNRCGVAIQAEQMWCGYSGRTDGNVSEMLLIDSG
jgi:hypothetical protein